MSSEETTKRGSKDSVFCDLFSDESYVLSYIRTFIRKIKTRTRGRTRGRTEGGNGNDDQPSDPSGILS